MNAQYRILVVEDKQTAALLIEKTLTNQGYIVTDVVNTGEEAVQKAQEDKPDLILMDIELPGAIDGIEAASRITSSLNIPVIYLTAYSNDETLQRVKMTNPFGFIVKPFKAKDLHSSIELALAKHDSEMRLAQIHQIQNASRRINRLITRARNREAMLSSICEYLCQTGGCSGACIYLFDNGGKPSFVTGAGSDNLLPQFDDSSSCLRRALNQPEPVKVTYQCTDCSDCTVWSIPNEGNAIIQRLECGDRIFGVLCVYLPIEIEDEVRLIGEIADDVAFGLRLIEVEKMRKETQEDLQTARESFTSIVEMSAVGILVLDQSKIVQYANPAACCFLNADRADCIDKPIDIPLVTNNLPEISFTLKNGGAGFAEVHQIDTVWQTKPATLITLNDITDRKNLEKQKEDFLNTVSHDLRTPLTSIKESLSLISSGSAGSVSGEQKEFLSLALKNIDRLKRMIDSLLVMARLQAGQLTLNKECIDIELLVDEVLATFAPLAANAGIILKKSSPDISLMTLGDSDKIVEVLNNLISNSLKFTQKGYVEVSLQDRDCLVECSVYDTGFGMSSDQLSQVFNKFQQFNRNNQKGIGLGLAISKGIIEAHNGTIKAESKEHEWTRFTFTLPKYNPNAPSR